jgi:hypothetical protein
MTAVLSGLLCKALPLPDLSLRVPVLLAAAAAPACCTALQLVALAGMGALAMNMATPTARCSRAVQARAQVSQPAAHMI